MSTEGNNHKNRKKSKQQILNKTVEMIMKGFNNPEIIKEVSEFGGITEQHVYNYIREAKPIVKEKVTDIYKDDLESTILGLEKDMIEAKQAKQYKLVFQIKQYIAKLKGLEIDRTDITTKGEKVNQIEVIKLIEVKPSNKK